MNKPETASWVCPLLTVESCERASEFLAAALDFAAQGEPFIDKSGVMLHVELRYRDVMIMLGAASVCGDKTEPPASSGVRSPMHLYVYVDDVDAQYGQAIAAGGVSLLPPTDMFWGDRMARFSDPDGYIWGIATKVGEFDPSMIPG